MEKFTVTFYPSGKKVQVDREKTILSAAISAGVHITSSCAGEGVCGRCKVIVKKGHVLTQATGRITLDERLKGYYLACLANVQSDLEVEVPPESQLELEKLGAKDIELRLKGIYEKAEEIHEFEISAKEIFKHSPLATKLYLELPIPNPKDTISDLERLYREIRKSYDIPVMQTGLVNIRGLGELLRLSDWKVTVTIGNRNNTTEIILIEPGDTSGSNFGVAFDIGTTTISGQLIDLNTKKIIGTKITYNKQATFGADVISRIIYAQKSDGLEKLHHAVIDGMNSMIEDLANEHNIDLNNVTCCVCAGNTTMIHLLLRVDPSFIRRDPYIPTANFVPVIRAVEAGIKINPRGLLSCIPGVASYVGGDITAGVLSSGLDQEENLSLLIDIGTNGEIVLGNKEWLISSAASAGPAFEGSGLTCGMRASNGAIQKIKIDKKTLEVNYEIIDNTKPKGICGSGYIDLLSELLNNQIIDRNGKIKDIKNKRIRETDLGREFVLVFKAASGIDRDIVITETDIDNLKRAKAAIFSAVSSLTRHMNLDLHDIVKIFIAGGFGNYIDIEKALRIGLLPDLDRGKYIFIGNSSLLGARMILLSSGAMQKSFEIAKKITYFELSADVKYMEEYVAALFFPHTDLSKFPSLKK